MHMDALQPRRIGMAVRDEDVDALLCGGHAPPNDLANVD
jgi:hypothetical protein